MTKELSKPVSRAVLESSVHVSVRQPKKDAVRGLVGIVSWRRKFNYWPEEWLTSRLAKSEARLMSAGSQR